MRGSVMTVNAIHRPLLAAFDHLRLRRHILDRRTVVIDLGYPGNGLIRIVCGNEFDMTKMRAMDSS